MAAGLLSPLLSVEMYVGRDWEEHQEEHNRIESLDCPNILPSLKLSCYPTSCVATWTVTGGAEKVARVGGQERSGYERSDHGPNSVAEVHRVQDGRGVPAGPDPQQERVGHGVETSSTEAVGELHNLHGQKGGGEGKGESGETFK